MLPFPMSCLVNDRTEQWGLELKMCCVDTAMSGLTIKIESRAPIIQFCMQDEKKMQKMEGNK